MRSNDQRGVGVPAWLTARVTDGLIVRDLGVADYERWRPLYRAYAEFYEQTEDMAATTWSWLTDPDHEVCGLVAELGDELVGLAHYRPFPRPLAATVGGFLDDLYVAPEARGSGAADAL